MMAAEFVLKKLPIRVCGIAPGVYETGMTADRVAKEDVDKIALGISPVPAQRPGRFVPRSPTESS